MGSEIRMVDLFSRTMIGRHEAFEIGGAFEYTSNFEFQGAN